MKIEKTKKDNYKLKLSHKELVMLKTALDYSKVWYSAPHENFLDTVNDQLMDKDELDSDMAGESLEWALWEQIDNELQKTIVW